MSRNSRLAFILVTAGVIAAFIPAAANAAEARSILVHTSDLNLASETGRAVLRQRLDGAVREVCQVSGWGFTLAAEQAGEACRDKTLAAAMRQADALVQAAGAGRVAVNRDVPVGAQ